MKPFIPKKLEPVAFAFLLSGIQAFVVTGISTVLAVGFSAELPALWLKAYFSSWAIAFPGVLMVAPMVKRILHHAVVT